MWCNLKQKLPGDNLNYSLLAELSIINHLIKSRHYQEQIKKLYFNWFYIAIKQGKLGTIVKENNKRRTLFRQIAYENEMYMLFALNS